uniref:Uncharacterized protein n=1 Tax=Hemiselmis andersenii TaxID=464988 RepID=A0A6U2CUR9_HEMAN|mmetsp:Transcript_22202/g.51587  ORF Transcript_22202/g.51587 Transcript_22202/m.51587 type:complete len:379 (+) Transcript_22202:113-1249(+)|eukprot:CAMPEP_0172001292 /NCGR_PEP_ID=MMETSP1041-20130122/2790_1 /TAXON_ID=464988 /ORGANISM="Hemiselmis andersenii, Strain CCMP439" /LENGTH=378 /DNA_ID=CAMNT_0012654919 /DNA_START=59 /DNA_END=1195 /DNA_ORIENTATION=-
MNDTNGGFRGRSARSAKPRGAAPIKARADHARGVEATASGPGHVPSDDASQPGGPAHDASRSDKRSLAGLVNGLKTLLHHFAVGMISFYIVWVLVGTCAWVSHLGSRMPHVGAFLPGYGAPGFKISSAAGIIEFLIANVPIAGAFVAPHSILLPHRMRRWVGSRYARLAYSLHSALTLHFLLSNFTPLAAPVVMELPIPKLWHNILSFSCLVYATLSFVAHDATWQLIGTRDALGRGMIGRRAPPKMDAITWMGMTVWERGGGLAFVLFTGLSILPAELTLGDVMTRSCAAVYLRLRSKGFRDWVAMIESAHLLTWGLRALLMVGWMQTAKDGGWISLAGGVALALLLRVVEASGGGGGGRCLDTASGSVTPPPTPPE